MLDHVATEELTLDKVPNSSKEIISRYDALNSGDSIDSDKISCIPSEKPKVTKILNSLKKLIPETFDPSFKNPCWYAGYHVDPIVKSAFRMDGRQPEKYLNIKKYSDLAVSRMKTVSKGKELVCLPYFSILGFAKCGTTALHSILTHHPEYQQPEMKEINWWSSGQKYVYGIFPLNTTYILRYLYHFSKAAKVIQQNPKYISGDASVMTVHAQLMKLSQDEVCTDGIPYIHYQLNPSSKYIIIMRDPVYRTESSYYFFSRFGCRKRPNPDSLHKAVQNDLSAFSECLYRRGNNPANCYKEYGQYKQVKSACYQTYFGSALYYYYIKYWMRHIPQKNFLFLRAEDLQNNATRIALRMFDFLEMSPPTPAVLRTIDRLVKVRVNENPILKSSARKGIGMKPETSSLLRNFFAPYNKMLANLLQDSKFLWT